LFGDGNLAKTKTRLHPPGHFLFLVRKVARLVGHESVLLGSSHHDFNQYVWSPEGSLDANANWQILSVDPLVPNGVVVFEILPIRQPYVGSQKFRFVGACLLQKTVDGFKHLLGLNAHITGWLGRHATSTDDSVVDYDKTD
jgi:hypothetical protein